MKTPFVKYAAKAVVAALVGPVLAVLAWLSAKVTPFEYDPKVVETVLTSVVTAVLVFVVRNAPKFVDARDALIERIRRLTR